MLNLKLTPAQRLANVKAGKSWLNQSETIEIGELNAKRVVWFTGLDRLTDVWRLVGYAHKVSDRIIHTGWYSDNDQRGQITGIVVRLPTRKRKSVYLAGWESSDLDTVCVFPVSYDDEHEAARAADNAAEHYAEAERENDARSHAELQIEDLTTELKEMEEKLEKINVARVEVFKCGHTFAADCLGDLCTHLERDVKKAESRIAALQDSFWNAVSQ